MPSDRHSKVMNEVEKFKSGVERVRNLLRTDGITGMESMYHICIYLLARSLTEETAKGLKIPPELTWKKIVTEPVHEISRDMVYNKHKKSCLVRYFDTAFGTNKFSFDVNEPKTHKQIITVLNDIDLTLVDCHMDILGYVYEQHLKTGAQDARDLGQFFTNRVTCEYMTRLCRPGFVEDGVPESVCDPTMGTGGFLTTFLRYYKTEYGKDAVDWSQHINRIQGCDTDIKVSAVSRINVFLEAGGHRSEKLETYNSLYSDLSQQKYDVILANMPFGIKGLSHQKCAERVRALGFKGNAAEPLFLQLMMVSLAKGGRCAVVVPDGMLFNKTKCHTQTRRYLVDNFELHRVVKMKGKFFMNTGIQPSILFFENTGNPTKEVEFWDVVKGDDDNLKEALVLSVPRERLDDVTSLDMRQYQEKVDDGIQSINGFETRALRELVHLNPEHISKSSTLDFIRYIDLSAVKEGHIDSVRVMPFADRPSRAQRKVVPNDILWGSVRPLSRSFAFLGECPENTLVSTGFVVIRTKHESVLPKYVYYAVTSPVCVDFLISRSTGSVYPSFKPEDMLSFQIPVPPLPIQEKMVEDLDVLETMITSLNTTITGLEASYKMEWKHKSAGKLHQLLQPFMTTTKPLGDIVKMKPGNVNSKDATNTGEYPFFSGHADNPSGSHNTFCFDEDAPGRPYILFVKSGGNLKTPVSPNLGIGKVFLVHGRSAGNVAVFQFKSYNPQGALNDVNTTPILRTDYIYHFLRLHEPSIQMMARYSTNNGNIDMIRLKEFPIPIPPPEVQEAFVQECEKRDAYLQERKAVIDQFKQEVAHKKELAREMLTSPRY